MSLQINYDDAIRQIEAIGIRLDRQLRFDAKTQRWMIEDGDRERRGWTRLREWTSDAGNTYLVGHFGIWQGNDPGTIKIELPRRDDKRPVLTDDEVAAIRAAQKEAAKRMEAERKAEALTAARWAATVWHACAAATEHDYLDRKQIGPHGTRVLDTVEGIALTGIDDANWYRLTHASGALVVPMHDAKGNVVGLQFVYGKGHPRRAKIERDKEFWPSGMAMSGSFGVIGHLRRTGVLLIAEGFATAASLHEATGQTVVYAFSANNLLKAGKEIRKQYPSVRLLFCADDDYLSEGNPGCKAAAEACAALELADWIKPDFAGPDGDDIRAGKKLTDYNDLAALSTLTAVAAQVNDRLDALKWRDAPPIPAGGAPIEGGGESMTARYSIDEAARRWWGTYGFGGKLLFDEVERRLVHKDDVLNLLPEHGWAELKKHPGWRVARDWEIGFDPSQADPLIRCNLFGGWPTVPKRGRCDMLLELLFYQCSLDPNAQSVYDWILKWLAYPLQNPGAKMHSAIVVHGPQGAGKNRFFEAYAEIYGPYGIVLGQDALEDKFNADWAEKKLFIVGDEVLARGDMFHIKNRLKSFVTGKTVRVNPKNVAAHTEKNCMNIVFLSNERQPIVLENDDRRHGVIWVPPKPSDDFFADLNQEIANGGVAALHDFLLNLDLGDFRPWTRPPMTEAKADLIELGLSSEERFTREWTQLGITGPNGDVLPFCPCLGSHLYSAYESWCKANGEFRPRPMNHFINYLGKQPGWTAGKPEFTWRSMRDKSPANRKMVVPASDAVAGAVKLAPAGHAQVDLTRDKFGSKAEWLTQSFFAFEAAITRP